MQLVVSAGSLPIQKEIDSPFLSSSCVSGSSQRRLLDVFQFDRFPTPHTGDASCAFLRPVLLPWGLNRSAQSITLENPSCVVSGISKLSHYFPKTALDVYSDYNDVPQRCIPHDINVALKEAMSVIHNVIPNGRYAISLILSSGKRRDINSAVCKELYVAWGLPGIDVDRRWSSTFKILKEAFIARHVMTATLHCITKLQSTCKAPWSKMLKDMASTNLACFCNSRLRSQNLIRVLLCNEKPQYNALRVFSCQMKCTRQNSGRWF